MAGEITITTYGCAEHLCRIGLLPGKLEYTNATPEPPRLLRMMEIQAAVARHFLVPVHEMKSARRGQEVARPRQVAMYLCREMTGKSTPQIGRFFGGRDHTTVLHACRQIERLSVEDPELAARIDGVVQELTA